MNRQHKRRLRKTDKKEASYTVKVAVAECTHFATALFVMEVFFMECIKLTVKSSLLYIRTLLKWTILATLVGLAGGIIGSLFHESVEIATSLREENGWLI